jgi:signal transduction histidine kinase
VQWRFQRPSVLTWLVAAMLVLLPMLAFLQFRWLGQLSDAERDRLQRNLRATTTELTTALDLELARLLVGLQLDGQTLREQAWSRYAERHAAWAAATADPALVRDVLLADAEDGETLRLRRWDPTSQAFVPAEWPDDLGPVRARVVAEHRTFIAKPEGLSIRPSELFGPDDASLVMPVTPIPPVLPDGSPGRLIHVFAFTIVRLNVRVLEEQLLPSLISRYFGTPRTSDYHVAVIERQGGRIVFQAAPGDAAALARGTDVAVDLYGIGPEQFPLMRQAMASLRLPPRNEPRRSLFFSVFGRRPGDTGPPRPADDTRRWRLLVRHRAGSLEAAVSHARWRNLALNFGILMLMSVSVGLIVIAARRAQALARQQMEFVAGVSHELRTPVSVIGAAADNLAQGVVTEAARVKQYGSTIQTEARRLGDTVERVLQFAGIQAGRASGHRVAVSPVDIVQDALAGSQLAVADAGAALERDVPAGLPAVLAEPAALRSALQNLLGNAIKYGGRSPWVRVSAREVRTRRGREVQIIVQDRGLGIPAADLPHIFEPFYRGGDAQSQQIHGNGLGLSIVRSIVEAHGGRVTVTSTPGEGSTFTMHLPVAHGEAAADGAGMQVLDGHRQA